jgi:glutathione S-transferase
MLRIYATPLSANGRKVLAVSRELGLAAEIALLSEQVGHRFLAQVIPRPWSAPDCNSASLQPLLKTLEKTLSADAFLTGSHATIADFSVAGMCTYLRVAAFPFHAFPAISRWYARIEGFDSWRATNVPPWSEQDAGEVTGD